MLVLALLPDNFPTGPLVLDASVIINLLGSGSPAIILAATGVDCIVVEQTLAEITRHPIPGLCHKEILSALGHDGHIQPHRMSSEEYALYLSMIQGPSSESLGDGESAAIAVAVSTKRQVILDDGKARRIHRARFPSAPVASSLQLFVAAGARNNWPVERIRDMVARAMTNARMNIVKGEESLLARLEL